MRALLKKTGEWVEIDTNHLFHDQYNTTVECGNRRIFDKDIARIEGDVREGIGKCKYCGTIVKRGEEEEHFLKREAQSCDGCFWYQNREVCQPEVTEESVIEKNTEGVVITRVTTITKRQYQRACAWRGEERETDCTNKECRHYGIDWFTGGNTFFLKFPNGFAAMGIRSHLRTYGFFPVNKMISRYHKPIGSYTLEAHFVDDNSEELAYFLMRNSRKAVRFRYENGSFYTLEWSTWKKSRLCGLPDYAYTGMRKVLDGILDDYNRQEVEE